MNEDDTNKNEDDTSNDTSKPDDASKRGYQVEKVEQTTPPEGMEDKIWHRYVIGHGNSRIEGKAPGTLEEVTQHAETLAEGFNLRRGKGGSTYTTRKRV